MTERIDIGRYIVADPEICHGKLTFKGTRIMVWQVLEMVAEHMDWDEIVREWRGTVSKEAIAEAVHLASKAFSTREFSEYAHENVVESLSA
jgi:uncharacterized protein (DUF433 family)